MPHITGAMPIRLLSAPTATCISATEPFSIMVRTPETSPCRPGGEAVKVIEVMIGTAMPWQMPTPAAATISAAGSVKCANDATDTPAIMNTVDTSAVSP